MDLVDLVSCLNDNKVIGIKDTIEAKHAVNLQYANINSRVTNIFPRSGKNIVHW